MSRVIFEPARGQRIPLRIWARDPPRDAVRQLQWLASQPWVHSHVAAMPDVHVAQGVCVGTVFATLDTLVPGALGGDLGCGVAAQRFAFPAAALDRGTLERILAALARVIPVSDRVHREEQTLPSLLLESPVSTRTLDRMRRATGARHIGTLGGGNHFVELDRDTGGDLWLLVHSGSRGVGSAIARHHRVAAGGDALAPLVASSEPGRAYERDALVAFAFARANRELMLARATDVLGETIGAMPEGNAIDVPHNFTARERHADCDVWVHRKGATPAREGEIGIVPGSMGTATYLVRGHGKPTSFASCSHGAGRVMTRTEARARVSAKALERAMRHVVFDRARVRDLVEEAPEVYRPIREVLEDQSDLVTKLIRMEPIAVLKG
jgi:tRNA-splicing ligase RtcB